MRNLNKTIMKQTKTMKQTAITISMINEQGMNRTEGQSLRAVDGEQRMTSMEIAELTGKQHKHVMEAIRRMEPAWEKVQGTKFRLSQRNYELPTGVLELVVPRLRDSVAESLCAVRRQRLQVGEEHRGLRALVAELRPVV